MSFILDALRKSEAERQRQDGPTLLEVRPSRPQRRMPLWVIGLGVLLLLNMGVLLWFLLRTPPEAARATHAGASAPASVTASAASTRPSGPPPVETAPVAANPLSVSPPVAAAPPAPHLTPSSSVAAGASPPPRVIAPTPAVAAAPRAAPAAKSAKPPPEASDSAANLPDYSHVASGLPALRLDLHSYSPEPDQRYALINMHKVREGDTLPEGPRVQQILPEGVVLSYNGTEFVLGRN